MTPEELSRHNTAADCWMAILGNVYDLTSFLKTHPGGPELLVRFAGKDATRAFQQKHPAGFLSMLPASCLVGRLDGALAAPVETRDESWKKPPLDMHLNVRDFEKTAEKVMDHAAWVYYSSAAEDQRTLEENQRAFRRWWFRPRVLVDVSHVHTATTVLGRATSFPLFISASAVAGLAHPEGEVALARAAHAAGVVQMVPTISTRPLDEIAAARAPGQSQFFQLYAHRDRTQTAALVRKVDALGFAGLFLTVDTPLIGRRERDIRNKFATGRGVIRSLGTISDPSLTWDDVDWLRGLTSMPLVLKGIQRGEDALTAVEHGVAGVLVSNHGGRQLDGARASLDVLVEVRQALGTKSPVEVYIDGGIRRGSDIVKALALGARAVGVSRAVLFGLASYGQEGAEAVLNLLHEELSLCMALNGARRVEEITPDLVVPGR